jgi:putative transposase
MVCRGPFLPEEATMLVSLIYLALRRVFELAGLHWRSREFKELEIDVLRHEPILRRRHGRPKLDAADRVFPGRGQPPARAGALELLPRDARDAPAPAPRAGREALDVCQAQPRPPCGRRRAQSAGAPARAREPARGYRRIAGEVAGLGVSVSQTIVRKLVGEAGLGPAGARGGLSWREFPRGRAQGIIACDCFTVETVTLRRIYVLFFSELGSRRVQLAGVAENPSGARVTQQARNVAWSLPQPATTARYLIYDRDSTFTHAFDEVFGSEGVEGRADPVRAAVAARFVRTVRAERLDWLLIADRRHLLRVYVDHDNIHRPHRALDLRPPSANRLPQHLVERPRGGALRRRDRLGGLIHEHRAAA